MLMRKRRCKAANKRGKPCGFAPLTDTELCWAYRPDKEEAAQYARRTGAANAAEKAPPRRRLRLRRHQSESSLHS